MENEKRYSNENAYDVFSATADYSSLENESGNASEQRYELSQNNYNYFGCGSFEF
ncbi:hypothetical protein EAL2_808p04860 (plasmid) [Peptoclostridium acidaminophilum DSM 3953]|uniref:Uncharacterized protein n=1 Tax=Peptoclostridium acidaminophilum DSM 3953 TaxID=1286171 RepID=W8T8F1_PEPAC|nr:hypothetical protein [Peptoclostridium acidaminophilum]AHM57989.1 hypothetical protein EAL2_808p04860 [Peptoclostridium acidaminophilum DSM 3953]